MTEVEAKERQALDEMKELAREIKETRITTADLDRLNRRIASVSKTLDGVRSSQRQHHSLQKDLERAS